MHEPRRVRAQSAAAVPAAAVAGALVGLAAAALERSPHGALVLTSDAATAACVVAAFARATETQLVRLVAAMEIGVFALTYAAQLGSVSTVCLLATTAIVGSTGSGHLRR